MKKGLREKMKKGLNFLESNFKVEGNRGVFDGSSGAGHNRNIK